LTGCKAFAGAVAAGFGTGLADLAAAALLPEGILGAALTGAFVAGFEVLPAVPVLAGAGLALTAVLTGALDEVLTGAFLLATGLAAFLGAGFTAALAFTAGFAELPVFLAVTFTVSLLLKPLSERPENHLPA
jgi:hypothetical protein